MKRLIALTLTTLACSQALAVGRLASVAITDRDSGEILETHYHRGEYWVAGRPGARYAISIRNMQDRRLLAVTSVDGINVVTGDTARLDQRGYVFYPGAAYDIAGWRKSEAEIAAFRFTAVPQSYASRTGRPENVGVIGVALFRERLPEIEPQVARESGRFEAPAPVAPAAAADASRAESRAKSTAAPALGTGHGERENSWVTHVDFQREHPEPDEIIRLRYDTRANLIAMGIIARPRPLYRPSPFPGEAELGYVPDP
jgi:hypothetical protein